MAWNNSESSGSAPSGGRGATALPRVGRGLVAGLIVAAGAGLALWLLVGRGGGDAAEKAKTNAPRVIAEAKPSAAPTNATVAKAEAPVKMKKIKHPLTGEEKWVPDIPLKTNAHNVSFLGQPIEGNVVNPPKRLFRHRSLGMLAGLVRTTPGATVVGIELPRNFDEDFAKAIKEETFESAPDDTEEEAETRKMVKEMAEDCKKIQAEGGSVREAIMEERNYLRKVADIRFTLQKEVSKMRREGASAEDLQDAVSAANKILSEYGSPKIRVSPFKANTIERKTTTEK